MERRLIINCDDFGQSKAMNEAIRHLLEENKVSSATIMTVAPGFEEAASWAARRRQPNVGRDLTMTSEFEALRWSALTGHSSLHDASGHQYRTVQEFERGAETGAVLKELEAQYRLASKAGIRISHVDNHMGAVRDGNGAKPHSADAVEDFALAPPARLFRYIYPEDPPPARRRISSVRSRSLQALLTRLACRSRIICSLIRFPLLRERPTRASSNR